MDLNTAAPRNRGATSRRRRIAGIAAVAAAAAALVVVPSAFAANTATVTLARIGSGPDSYLVTVNNTTTESIAVLGITAANGFEDGSEGFEADSVVPSTCKANIPLSGAIGCEEIPAGGTQQVCYNGPPADSVTALFTGGSFPLTIAPTTAPKVGKCPLAGFVPTPAHKHKKKKHHHHKHHHRAA